MTQPIDKADTRPHQRNIMRVGSLLALLPIGIGTGILIGLSVSPVVSVVIASIVAAAGTVVAILGGYQENPSAQATAPMVVRQVNPWPLAVFVLCLVVGALLGIQARTKNWLGSDLSGEIQKWQAEGIERDRVVERLFANSYPDPSPLGHSAVLSTTLDAHIETWTSLGMERDEVITRLFDAYYTVQQESRPAPQPFEGDPAQTPVLYNVAIEECAMLQAEMSRQEDELFTQQEERVFLNSVAATEFGELLKLSDDTESIRQVIEVWCETE